MSQYIKPSSDPSTLTDLYLENENIATKPSSASVASVEATTGSFQAWAANLLASHTFGCQTGRGSLHYHAASLTDYRLFNLLYIYHTSKEWWQPPQLFSWWRRCSSTIRMARPSEITSTRSVAHPRMESTYAMIPDEVRVTLAIFSHLSHSSILFFSSSHRNMSLRSNTNTQTSNKKFCCLFSSLLLF